MVQSVFFSSGRNNIIERVFMSHPRHGLCLASCPSPASFLKESGSSCFRSSDGCSGQNIVWMTNRATVFARSILCSSSTVIVMMLSMNPSIDASVAVMSTAKGYAVAIWLVDCCFSSCGSKDRCGGFRSSLSQDSSRSRSFPRSIAASLTVIYYYGAGMVTKGNLSQRKSSSSTIAMNFDAVVAFSCIRW